MSKNYFENCNTNEEIKARYHELAKQLHPDCGGNAEEFKEMKAQFEQAFKNVGSTFTNREGKTYTKQTTQTAADFMNIIEKIIHMENVTIEIIGTWIWVTGDTKPYRENLKELHFFWSQNKKAWYYNGEENKKRTHSKLTMDDLRNKWGSEEIEKESNKKLTA